LSFLFTPIVGLLGLCCFKTSKGKGSVLIGAAVGTLIFGVTLIAGWYLLSNVFGSLEAVAKEIDVNDDSGITKPGWYYKDDFGAKECFGPAHKYQGNDCTYETGVTGLVSSILDSDDVSDAFDQYVGYLKTAAFAYFGIFGLFLVVGCFCVNKRH
jgi:hypothetical protein